MDAVLGHRQRVADAPSRHFSRKGTIKIRLVPRAIRDLEEIKKYIAADDAAAAARVVDRLIESIELLAQRPELGRPVAGRPVREWSVPGLPYLVPYVIREDVVILRVYHTRRKRPKRW